MTRQPLLFAGVSTQQERCHDCRNRIPIATVFFVREPRPDLPPLTVFHPITAICRACFEAEMAYRVATVLAFPEGSS